MARPHPAKITRSRSETRRLKDKMKTKKFVLLTIFCLAAATAIVANAQEKISEQEFSRQFRAAFDKTSAATHRQLHKEELYEAGKLSRTVEITDEFVQPDRRHYVYVGKFGDDGIMKFELIQIGDTYYCREDGKWRKSENWCANGSVGAGVSNIISSESTVEETKLDNRSAKLYRQYITYKNPYARDKEVVSYQKQNFWVGGDGFLLRSEIEYGKVKPAEIDRKLVETYEYDANIKIEAPVVAAKRKRAK